MTDTLVIAGTEITPDSRGTVEFSLPQLYTHTPMTMPVHVIRGRREGPSLFVSAAIHGDELNGVEVIRRLIKHSSLKRLKGTLIAIPIVNVYGVIQHSRYLPDRRDLNRSFPGSERGSMASRLANLFMNEIVANCSHGIDLHTGAIHRDNLPQIRANLSDEETLRLAHAFGVPVLLDSTLRDGSLREAAAEYGIPMLLYEAGEGLRFDELGIRAGLRGVLNVMRALGMLPKVRSRVGSVRQPYVAHSSTWIRAPESGVLRALVSLGSLVKKGDVLGRIADPFGVTEMEVKAARRGIVIGRTNIPLVHEGEALFHIGHFEDIHEVAGEVESFQVEHTEKAHPLSEPPIV